MVKKIRQRVRLLIATLMIVLNSLVQQIKSDPVNLKERLYLYIMHFMQVKAPPT